MQLRSTLALAALSLTLLPLPRLVAQAAPTPAAPAASAPQAAPPYQSAPAVEAPKPVPGPPPFPLVDRANFTATTPTVDQVNAFLKSFWGFDPNRLWQVQAILKTSVQGLSRVVVLIEEKGAPQQQGPQTLGFFVLPDGAHLIAGEEIMPFGADPFAANRKTLQTRADGPSKGVPAKALEFVEFADFQCPHCKDAQPTIERLMKDFPSAHFVFENFPIASHSEAEKAAEYGVCVAKEGGNEAFYKFSDDVFTNQAKLTPDGSTDALKASVTAAGQDPAKVATCAALPETKTTVDASAQLGKDLGVNQTPFLFINGRGLPLGGVPYDTLKQMVIYQAQLDGVPTQ
jgi:protein-disulfide isomerase